ncbi:hypothetical protein CMUS01_07530 [Colletotrichum musicola]|uniref:Zn(2)-C6 fungal-type domain-containing protein n=1 Tax=Colletotrichum musicola TaxID=2175873 RepID=A0A8H6KHN5_9PEZI|nr:hypothetical protein CMUS01_07530 [Colletotrichum musicola]
MESRQRSPTPLLKTCRTCAHAKIKCDRTQDSTICDRCLRLGKECTYAPSRGRRPPGPRSRSNRLLQVPDKPAPTASESPATSESFTSDPGRASPPTIASSSSAGARQHRSSRGGAASVTGSNEDPFNAGQLTIERGQELLDRFREKLTPHFPFILIPASETVSSLRQNKPALCLALLAAASFDDVRLQRALGLMFNELVASRLLSGDFTCLDVLQGLLVHLAWAHFQPRPKRYLQHLHLATSIVSDLRLDRSKRRPLWNVESLDTSRDHVDSLDERRTFLGTYYLASCSSIVLQRLRTIALTSYVTETADQLSENSEYPTDQYLPYIIGLQRLAEDVDDIVKTESTLDPMQIHAAVSDAKERVETFKTGLTFPLGDCPLLVPQLHTIQLCLNQLSLPDSPFGLHNPRNSSSQLLIQGLSESIVSAKSLVSILLHTPTGQEVYFPNIVWVMLHCAFSLAVRLDLQASDPAISPMTEHLRQFSDLGHTIRQVVMRLGAIASPDLDDTGDRDSFYHFWIRARRVEDWYMRHQQRKQPAGRQDVSPQSFAVPTTTPFSSLATPASNLPNQTPALEYSIATPMFPQPAVVPTTGALTFSDFALADDGGVAPNPSFSMDDLAFTADTFIPFKSWNFSVSGDNNGGMRY